MKRWIVPVAAAVAVLVVLGGFWLASRDDDSSAASPGSGGLPSASPSDLPAVAGKTMPVGIDSYFSTGDDSLTLNYSIGVPECYGKLSEPPAVEEDEQTVKVTLQRVEPKPPSDVACIEIAMMKSVTVHLDAPLGDRRVRDGSQRGKVVVRADAPYENSDS
jgi:hypothetical protein